VGVLERERAVGGAELLDVGCALEALGGLQEGVGDQRRFERTLVAHVLVERGRLDAEAVGEPAHGDAG
jgi:hypothetical protein